MLTEQKSEQGGLPRGIGRPATNALAHIGITRLEQLTEKTEKEIASLHGVGPKAIRVLREALASNGLGFGEERS